MGHKRNTISGEEHKKRSMVLINNGAINNRTELDELYFLYNDVMLPREQDKSCGSCRAKVWRRLKAYYGI